MKNILKALAKFHSQISCIPKEQENPFHHSKYSGLDTVYNHIKKELLACGLWFYHISEAVVDEDGNKGVKVRTKIYHIESGEELDNSPVELYPSDFRNPQIWGSLITYAKRYSLQIALGLPSEAEDDDANLAAGVNVEIPKKESHNYNLPKQEKLTKSGIPLWLEIMVKKTKSEEELEKLYKNYEKSCKNYGTLDDFIEKCKQRKLELNKPAKGKKHKIDSPEKNLSEPTRDEIISKIAYYAKQIYGDDFNVLDLFMDDDGVCPSSVEKIETTKLKDILKKLEDIYNFESEKS